MKSNESKARTADGSLINRGRLADAMSKIERAIQDHLKVGNYAQIRFEVTVQDGILDTKVPVEVKTRIILDKD